MSTKKRKTTSSFMKPKKLFKRSRTTVVIPRPITGIAPRIVTTLTYSEIASITATVAAVDVQYRLNSLFDPTFAAGGHQPYGFDQLAELYDRYRVYKTEYIVEGTENANPGMAVAVIPTNSSTAFTNMNLASETDRAIRNIAYASKTLKVSGSISLPELTGATPQQYKADDRYQAQISADPTEVCNLHIVAQPLDGSTSNTLYFRVTLKFHCEFFDRAQLAQS